MFGGFRIFDAHCHIYPEKIAERAVEGIDSFYGVLAHGRGTVADLIEKGDKAGVDRFLVHSVATNGHQVRSINEFIAGEVEKLPDRLTGFGTLYPGSETVEEDYEHLRSLGLKGVKLHPDFQRSAVDGAECRRIFDLCERDGFPVLVHLGDIRKDYSNPDRASRVLEDYPSLKIIGAHLGGWSVWKDAADRLSQFENLYVDCCSSTAYLSDSEFCRCVEKFGASRVIFGTDYPLWRSETEIKALLRAGFTDSELGDIFYNNIVRFLGE